MMVCMMTYTDSGYGDMYCIDDDVNCDDGYDDLYCHALCGVVLHSGFVERAVVQWFCTIGLLM